MRSLFANCGRESETTQAGVSMESKQKTQIVTNKIKCRKCSDIIESEHRRDFKFCSCGSIFVDGGKDYFRRGGEIENIEDMSEVKSI